MVKVRSSRRVAGLKPTDYDHEIDLVNHDGAEHDSASTSQSPADTQRGSTTSPLLSSVAETEQDQGQEQQQQQQASSSQDSHQSEHGSPEQDAARHAAVSRQQEACLASQNPLPHPVMQPSIEIQGKPDP